MARGNNNCFLDSNENGDVYCLPKNGGNYQKWKAIFYGHWVGYSLNNEYDMYYFENVATGLRLDNDENNNRIYTSSYVSEGANTKWTLSRYGCLMNHRTKHSANVNPWNGQIYPVVQGECHTNWFGNYDQQPSSWATVRNYFN